MLASEEAAMVTIDHFRQGLLAQMNRPSERYDSLVIQAASKGSHPAGMR
jgi:hypothetical protein